MTPELSAGTCFCPRNSLKTLKLYILDIYAEKKFIRGDSLGSKPL